MQNRPINRKETKGEGHSLGTDHQEIEWQYDATGGLEKVEEWLGGCEPRGFGFVLFRGSLKELADTYYDTEDWRLYRGGYALRVRRVGESCEATIKTLTPAGGAAGNLHRRREISEPFESEGVEALLKAPSPIGVRLNMIVGPRELRTLFEIHTHRRAFDLLDVQLADPGEVHTDGSDARVGEIALDSSEIPLGGNEESVHLARVEVEPSAASSSSLKLESFMKAMEEALGLRPAALSKYEAGLFATGQSLLDGEASREVGDKGSERE